MDNDLVHDLAMESGKVEECGKCPNLPMPVHRYPCNQCHYVTKSKVNTVEEEDVVKKPKHYQLCDMEAIDIINKTLSEEELKGYILGNVLKYRLRAGKKGDMSKTYEDIQKANQYEEMYDRYFG